MPGPQTLCSSSARPTQDVHTQSCWGWGSELKPQPVCKARGNSVAALSTCVIMSFALNTL